MTAGPTFYEVLGVDQDATDNEIRRAYRMQARATHPDQNPGAPSSLFVLIQQAYDVLSNPGARAEYDESIGAGASSGRSRGRESSEDTSASQRPEWPAHNANAMAVGRPELDDLIAAANATWRARQPGPPPEPSRRRPVFAIAAIAFGLVVMSALVLAPETREVLSWAWWVQVLVLVPCIWIAARGFWPAMLVPLGLHLLVMGVLLPVVSGADWRGVDGIVFLGELVALVACLAGSVVLARRRRARSARTAWPTRARAPERGKVYGKPGAGLDDAVGKFGHENVSKGVLGEALTGDALWSLIEIPGVDVVHGLVFPSEGSSADVDHAVVCGSRVALLDSKLWAPGHHSWTWDGSIRHAHGTRALDGDTNFPFAVERYSELLDGMNVRGWVVVHTNGDEGKASFDNANAPRAVRMGDPATALREVAEWLVEGYTGSDVRVTGRILNFMR